MQAVSFSKGCYLGQEIVERVRARGAVHKHLVKLVVVAMQPPSAGTELLAEGGARAGVITSAAYSPVQGGVVAMGYVNVAFAKPGTALTLSGDLPQRVLVQ